MSVLENTTVFNENHVLAISLGGERAFCALCALVIMARLSSPSRSWWQAPSPLRRAR